MEKIGLCICLARLERSVRGSAAEGYTLRESDNNNYDDDDDYNEEIPDIMQPIMGNQ